VCVVCVCIYRIHIISVCGCVLCVVVVSVCVVCVYAVVLYVCAVWVGCAYTIDSIYTLIIIINFLY